MGWNEINDTKDKLQNDIREAFSQVAWSDAHLSLLLREYKEHSHPTLASLSISTSPHSKASFELVDREIIPVWIADHCREGVESVMLMLAKPDINMYPTAHGKCCIIADTGNIPDSVTHIILTQIEAYDYAMECFSAMMGISPKLLLDDTGEHNDIAIVKSSDFIDQQLPEGMQPSGLSVRYLGPIADDRREKIVKYYRCVADNMARYNISDWVSGYDGIEASQVLSSVLTDVDMFNAFSFTENEEKWRELTTQAITDNELSLNDEERESVNLTFGNRQAFALPDNDDILQRFNDDAAFVDFVYDLYDLWAHAYDKATNFSENKKKEDPKLTDFAVLPYKRAACAREMLEYWTPEGLREYGKSIGVDIIISQFFAGVPKSDILA